MDWNQTLPRYCFLMEMIKWRLDTLKTSLSPTTHQNPLDWALGVEASYLHVRKICEFISIGCLLVHGDIPGTRSSGLRKTWKADEILEKMESLYDKYFPVACTQILNAEEKTIGHSLGKDHAITKTDLIHTYRRCGEVLHAGSLKEVEEMKPWPADAVFLTKKINGITRLLENHRIEISCPGHYVSVILASRQRQGLAVAHMIKGSVHDTSAT